MPAAQVCGTVLNRIIHCILSCMAGFLMLEVLSVIGFAHNNHKLTYNMTSYVHAVVYMPVDSTIILAVAAASSCQVYSEGTHLMLPWFDRPIIYDVRARPSLITSTSGSRDLQMVRV